LYSEVVTEVKRTYRAPVREEQARRTRARIVQTAADLFGTSGWAGTTIAKVADAAGVSPQAVHLSVGAKPRLLIEAVAAAVAGDGGDSRPLREREPFRSAYDPEQPVGARAEAFARGTRLVYERAGALFVVLAQTAPLEPELASLWEQARTDRLSDCRKLVRTAGHTGRPGKLAADQVFVLSGPGVHAELMGLGWSGNAYETWLAQALAQVLGGV
jgi:AcrR family transcriptional regulator